MKKGQKKTSNLLKRVWGGIGVSALTTMFLTIPTYASNTYAEAGARWVLDGVFWIVLVVGIGSAGMSAVKRNATAAVGIIIATALVCIVCQNPETISNLGNTLKGILGL